MLCSPDWSQVLPCWPPPGQMHLPCLQELRPLVYPVVQLLSGTVRLVPTQRYFPLRLRCVRALITLSQATGVFIPTSPLLLEMLKWGELSKAPRAAGGEGGSAVGLLARQLRVSKNTLRMRGFQEEIVMQVGNMWLQLPATSQAGASWVQGHVQAAFCTWHKSAVA